MDELFAPVEYEPLFETKFGPQPRYKWCFFCSPYFDKMEEQHSQKLTGILDAYCNMRDIKYNYGYAISPTEYLNTIDKMYDYLRRIEKNAVHTLDYFQWLIAYMAVVFNCDLVIIQSVLLHFPESHLCITKRDIHEHCTSHRTHRLFPGGPRITIVPWQTHLQLKI